MDGGQAPAPGADAQDAPETKEHRYRYLANLGTFEAHHWLRQGADRKRPALLRAARDHIREAIHLNPDAHFGREKYQLRALEWLLKAPPAEGGRLPDLLGLGLRHEARGRSAVLEERGLGDAVEGLSGLIVLGDAWESVDVYHALARALQHEGHSSLAYLAHMRCEELIDAGKRSLHPGVPAGTELKEWLGADRHPVQAKEALAEDYATLRAEADLRHRDRTAFMLARLQAGRHPDTDSEFWTGYQEPRSPRQAVWWERLLRAALVTVLGIAAGLAALGLLVGRRRRAQDKPWR